MSLSSSVLLPANLPHTKAPGLLAYRGLDKSHGLTEMIAEILTD